MAACSIQATLANILQRLRIVEDNQGRSNAAIAKLRLEMEDGSSRIQELEFSHESALREINSLLQRFGEQMATSRRKEQEKLRAAFARLREEIEEERNTCRLLKLQNKKLMKELEEANMAAADAGEELDRERQARELMEEVCNELAREIGEDKAEVEQLKQEQKKSREMVEEELKMIRLASLWRGERVKSKTSEAQLELDDKHHMAMSLPDLKSRVEEFVSTVSAASCEPYKALDNVHKESKQKKIIDQAKLLRRALELSMQQVTSDGGVLQAQTDIDLKEETIMTPITNDQYTQYTPTNVCDCCSDKVCKCENQSMGGTGGHVELQLRSGNYMVDYTKKPCEDARRPRMVVEDGLFNQTDAAAIPQTRTHSLSQHANDGEFQERGSRRIVLDTDCIQAPLNESALQCNNRTPSMKGAVVHQKHLSLHFEASQSCVGEIADAWEDDLTPDARRVICYSEDDASQVCMDEEAGFRMLLQRRRGCPDFRVRAIKQTTGLHPWKSPGMHEEDIRDGDGVDHHAERLMHHEYEGAKSLCADGADSVEEHGEFDGFYFEPVMDDDLLEDHCEAHYPQEPIMDGHSGVADCDDEHQGTTSKVYERSVQQNRSPKQLTCKSLPHDGDGWTSAKSGGTPTKSIGREETLPTPAPPHKLVLPTPIAIRVPSIKTYYTSPRSGVRSSPPSKPQVLQCFRPPPTSPEHDSAKSAVSSSGKGAKGVETEQSGSSRPACLLRASSNKRACDKMREEKASYLGEQGQQEVPRGAMEDKKANSLRAELLKARELDLEHYGGEHVNYDASAKTATPPPPNKASSFRFSPLRRSLTSTSQAGR